MKYGKYEYERTYLVDSDCLSDYEVVGIKNIRDKYIKDTHLRLRKVEENEKTRFKLTQKQELKPTKQGVKKINTLYLTEAEFGKLNMLEGFVIEKLRHILKIDKVSIGVDEVMLDSKKLFIAEVEFENEMNMKTFLMPLNAAKEVTGEVKYSGFAIAVEYSKSKS